MFCYCAYGLIIQSELPIPEFLPAQGTPDIVLRVDRQRPLSDVLPAETLAGAVAVKLTTDEALVYLRETGIFQVRNGRDITLFPVESASADATRLSLVGNIMAIALYQRGYLVLHASVVEIEGSAVAFLGVSGEGKSSMAAAFYAQGHRILTDDVAAIAVDAYPPTVIPGFPQIKLCPEAADALGFDLDQLRVLHPRLDKRGFRLSAEFPYTTLPVRAVFVLTTAAQPGIESITAAEAVKELSRHSRPTTMGLSGGVPHFRQCATLAQRCPVYRLNRPRDLSLLPQLVASVKQHIAQELLSPSSSK